MAESPPESLDHFLRWRLALEDPPVELDLGLAGLDETACSESREGLEKALGAMAGLEAGAKANIDEDRMVGHYWLRAPGLAPDPEICHAISETVRQVEEFAAAIHAGRVVPPEAGAFRTLLLIGIGGSALGPMLVADALSSEAGPMRAFFLDNTDPDGIERVLGGLGDLTTALVVVVSKSGKTAETRNGMLEVRRACEAAGLFFPARAVAVTGEDSLLWQQARQEDWLASFPIWEWVGGRTSLWSPVGLLPAALTGLDVRGLLAGAAAMDDATRASDPRSNPAAMLALFWHHQGGGRGARDMVVLPYKDRLLLLSRYLQQLVMESLGKARDRQGRLVEQGITVYGNKGSTDQHACVQQLRDGLRNSFVVFVRVLNDRDGPDLEVDPGVTSGDYLDAFWQGTREALYENGRNSATITLDQLDERSLGAVIALFERAVGLYAELVDVNAYNQPGVEAGKKAAARVLELQGRVLDVLDGTPRTCDEIAAAVGARAPVVWSVLRHLAANRAELRVRGPQDPRRAGFWIKSGPPQG